MAQPDVGNRACVLWATRLRAPERAPVFGLAAVERTALAFARAGVRRFLVAGEPEAAAEVVQLLRSGACHKLRVRAVQSVVAAVGDRPFYLARTDCHYARDLIGRFVAETHDAIDSVVALDLRAESRKRGAELPLAARWGDGAAATVQRLGRPLVAADGVLTGIALCTATWARALDGCRGRDGPWLGALGAVVRREPVETWVVAERWHAVRRIADIPAARREVLAGAVGVGDGLIAVHVNRPISLRITERLLSRSVKPWQVSLLSFGMTLAAGLAFAVGHATTGGLLAQGAGVMDGVHGELEQVRFQDSAFRGVYAALLDRIGDAVVIGGMTLYAWVMGSGAVAVVLGFGAVAGSSLSMLVKEKYGTQFSKPWITESEGRWRWLLLGRDGRLFWALVAGVTGQVELVLGYLAVGTHVHAGARIFRVRAEAAGA